MIWTLLSLSLCRSGVEVLPLGSAGGTHWFVSNGNGTIDNVPATVPGCAHTDLLKAGIIGEPNYGANGELQRWIASENFTYRTAPFAVPPALAARRNVDLVLAGVDTAAELYFNGKHVLAAANQHRTYIVDVASLVKKHISNRSDGGGRSNTNTLVAKFTGPVPASLASEAECKALPESRGVLCADANCTCPSAWSGPAPRPLMINAFIRKEQQSFSWDFAPATGTTGVTKQPTIAGYNSALIRGVVVSTTPIASAASTPASAGDGGGVGGGGWTVDVSVRLWSTHGPAAGYEHALLSATFDDATALGKAYGASATVTVVAGETVAALTVTIPAVAGVLPWWPNGYGNQPLYKLTVSLAAGGGGGATTGERHRAPPPHSASPLLPAPSFAVAAEVQTLTKQVGFRTIRIDQSPISYGGDGGGGDERRYRFVVNGVPIYSRGSNWVPSQSLEARVTKAQVDRHFAAYRAAHFTNIRVWGGGVYASDDFMDAADASGMIVTHDFMFGDQFYTTNAGFLANVAAEVRDQAWRLGSHPSLGIWCGNNEMASGYAEDHHFFSAHAFYSKLYFETIFNNLTAVDPFRAANWISSTPAQGNETAAVPYNRNGSSVELRGDMHAYFRGTWGGPTCWDVSALARARFVTETGYESWPSLLTMARSLDPDDYGFNSTVAKLRQQHPPGQAEITWNVVSNWRWPNIRPSSTAAGYRDELWMTQVAASQCLTVAAEFWRGTANELINSSYSLSPKGWAMLGENAGVMYWQADDTWPGPSWSTIELDGRWKVGHYGMQRAFAPLLVAGNVDDTSGQFTVKFSRAGHNDGLPGSGDGDGDGGGDAAGMLPGTQATLRVTALPWAGAGTAMRTAASYFDVKVQLPAAHSSTAIYSNGIAPVLAATGCGSRDTCVLTLAVTVDDASNGGVVASNHVYLSPFHQVTTMARNPGLKVVQVVAADDDLGGPGAAGASSAAVFNVTVAADRIPVAMVWLETPLAGRWSDNGLLLTTPTVMLQWISDGGSVNAATLKRSLDVWSLVDVASGYSSASPP